MSVDSLLLEIEKLQDAPLGTLIPGHEPGLLIPEHSIADLKGLAVECRGLRDENERLNALVNVPHTADWLEAVPLEAAHQLGRWGSDHDEGKEATDWIWLIGWLVGKAANSQIAGDIEKAKHHTISSAAVLLNWHRRLSGVKRVFAII